MNVFPRKILLACCFFFLFIKTNGQVKLYAVVSPNEMYKESHFNYTIIVENASSNIFIQPPVLKDFDIIQGPITISGINPISGTAGSYTAIRYELKPKRQGKFTIGKARIRIAEKTFTTNTTSLLVMSGMSDYNRFHQRKLADFNDYIFHEGDSLASKVNKNMELRVDLDKTTCFVGEPVVATYKLYTRLRSDSRLTQTSSFTGFSAVYMLQQDVDENGDAYMQGKLNGKTCNILPVRKAQLYPLQAGTINLESAELEARVLFIKEAYAKQLETEGRITDDFPNFLFPSDAVVYQAVTLKTIPVNIVVKPLPETNKPVSFKGAVGNFSIDASLQKPIFPTDEPGKLSVTISGSGNMQLVTAPDINWPKGMEFFEPKLTENLVKETVPLSGNKKFEYSFAANDTGHYTLPAISFSYFDPASVSYKTISSAPIAFQVTKGTGHPTDLSAFTQQTVRPSFINRIFYHRSWIIIFIAGLILVGLIAWLIKDKKSSVKEKVVPLVKTDIDASLLAAVSAFNQTNVFSETEKCLYQDDCFGFYTLMNTELKTYLGHKFSIDPNTVNSNTIATVLDKKSIPNEVVLKLQQLMQTIEWQLYTPFERNDKMNELYQQAHETVQLINTYNLRHL